MDNYFEMVVSLKTRVLPQKLKQLKKIPYN